MTPERIAELRSSAKAAARKENYWDAGSVAALLAESLDASEALQAENARLREALKQIGDSESSCIDCFSKDHAADLALTNRGGE